MNEIILEIHAGEGGSDSKNFVHELAGIYVKYSAKKNIHWLIEHVDDSSFVARLSGIDVWRYFKNESGKHVIQRIPVTERNGRKQTSVVMVAVLPLPPEQSKGLLPLSEIEVKCQCSGGPGGQHRNKTASAVRMKHIPTGVSVFIANERCQFKNKTVAHRMLSAKVTDYKNSIASNTYTDLRQRQLGNGSRGDKVRTYNVMESRVVDHRLGTKTSNIKEVMKGNLDLILKQ